MTVTGEHHNLLICGLGRGNIQIYGIDRKNQLDIFEAAHNEHIIKVVSLSKLQDKYFATMCVEGHVHVWSATNHPDRLFALWQIAADEEELAPLQPPPAEPEPIVEKKKKKKVDEDGNEISGEEEEEEEVPEEEAPPKKKGKPEPARLFPPKLLVGAPEPSEKDLMIEI